MLPRFQRSSVAIQQHDAELRLPPGRPRLARRQKIGPVERQVPERPDVLEDLHVRVEIDRPSTVPGQGGYEEALEREWSPRAVLGVPWHRILHPGMMKREDLDGEAGGPPDGVFQDLDRQHLRLLAADVDADGFTHTCPRRWVWSHPRSA